MDIKSKRYSAIILVIVAIIIAFDFSKQYWQKPTSDQKNQIELINCIDGDTANFTKIGKTRFLIIDTPESNERVEPYGKQASKFTCDTLKKAKLITYEYDGKKKDKFDRTLAWIFVDGKLLQELIAKEGYIKKFYIYKEHYKYEDRVRSSLNDKFGIFRKDKRR